MLKLFLTSFILFFGSVSSAFETEAKYAILIDFDTQDVLYQKNAYNRMAPSSMSKMMTAYLAFEALKTHQIKLEDSFTISEKAWKMGGSRMFIPINHQVSFEELLKGLIIQSGNDAAVAISEILAGSEEEFAEKMNQTAVKIGMKNTNFTNSTGLPEANNYSCAYDLAVLGEHTIRDFPQYYNYYAEKEFTFNNIKQGNRNGLLYRNIGADGIKTGHAEEAGYGLTASVKKGDRRIIAVVNGLRSNKERTAEAEKIITYGLMNFTNITLAKEHQVIEKIKIVNGKDREIAMISPGKIVVTIPKNQVKHLKTSIDFKNPLSAPIKIGTKLGILNVEAPGIYSRSYRLVSGTSVEKANFIDRISQNIAALFTK